MRKRMKKLQSRQGFTLTEMLCTLAVLALLGVALVTGLRFGARYYEQITTRAQAQILCTTLSAAIRQELGYTGEVKAAGGEFSYRSEKLGEDTRFAVDERGRVVLTNGRKTEDFISAETYIDGLRADLKILWESDTRLFTVYLQIKDRENTGVLAAVEFQVRQLNGGT